MTRRLTVFSVLPSLAAAMLLGLGSAPAIAGEFRLDAGISEWAGVRLRTVRLRIEPRPGAKPGECLELGPLDLKVSLRGKPLPEEQLIRLERERQANLHALVIDTSGSMKGKMNFVREAAGEYVRQLRPGLDRAMLISFDDSVVLLQGATAEVEALERSIDLLRIGGGTTLNDALYYAIHELDAHLERPVILLVTDANINSSYHQQFEIGALATNRPDLAIFTIGLGMPELSAGGVPGLSMRGLPGTSTSMQPGASSTRKFLQNLSRHSNGKWFDVPTGGRLDRVFVAIREMLESEATLEFIDTDPELDLGKISVSSETRACKIRVLRQHGDPQPEPKLLPLDLAPRRLPFTVGIPPESCYKKQYEDHRHLFAEPSCKPQDGLPWYLVVEHDRIHGCGLDITMEPGPLYSSDSVSRRAHNAWIQLRTRPFGFPLPPIDELPTSPAGLLDDLARFGLTVADLPPEPEDFKTPAHLHARQYSDYPGLLHGRIFLETRPRLAQAIFGQPEYRAHALEQLEQRAQRELNELRERFRRSVPSASDEILGEAVRQSDRGRAILSRAEQPTESDLMGYLAAWLGDIPAHDLFLNWERLHIDRMLGSGDQAEDAGLFFRSWVELRKIFFVPSYSRVLTLLSPVRDLEGERIGFYRVVLPRPSWLLPRVKGLKRHPDYKNMPLDLVPELPYGYLVLQRLMHENPRLAAHLKREGYRLVECTHESLVKPWRQDPRSAFLEVRTRLRLEQTGGAGLLKLNAHLLRRKRSPEYRLESLELSSAADPPLDRLVGLWRPKRRERLRIASALAVGSAADR